MLQDTVRQPESSLATLLDSGVDDDIAMQLDMEPGTSMDQGMSFDNAGMADSMLAGFWPNDSADGNQWQCSQVANRVPMGTTGLVSAENNWLASEFLDMMNDTNGAGL
jgi:hypothetical protein